MARSGLHPILCHWAFIMDCIDDRTLLSTAAVEVASRAVILARLRSGWLSKSGLLVVAEAGVFGLWRYFMTLSQVAKTLQLLSQLDIVGECSMADETDVHDFLGQASTIVKELPGLSCAMIVGFRFNAHLLDQVFAPGAANGLEAVSETVRRNDDDERCSRHEFRLKFTRKWRRGLWRPVELSLEVLNDHVEVAPVSEEGSFSVVDYDESILYEACASVVPLGHQHRPPHTGTRQFVDFGVTVLNEEREQGNMYCSADGPILLSNGCIVPCFLWSYDV
mmetsp:Transcript_56445/g.165026  ORF Transcript_56445/g.165026 Transcript_56445/m.165026 type:complete len:278 (+) Transcript_56445:61-894(+)